MFLRCFTDADLSLIHIYNEHCIVFNGQHVPMKIERNTFVKLFDFIKPVSYTHLDVYKRQPYTIPKFTALAFLL